MPSGPVMSRPCAQCSASRVVASVAGFTGPATHSSGWSGSAARTAASAACRARCHRANTSAGAARSSRTAGMPVRDMQRYAELVRSGAGEAERLELLKRHREEVRRALASQRECLKLLDAKIDYYATCVAAAPQANAV